VALWHRRAIDRCSLHGEDIEHQGLSLCTAVAGTAALLSGVGDERAMVIKQGYTWDARARY
jgi:hypothetical protein